MSSRPEMNASVAVDMLRMTVYSMDVRPILLPVIGVARHLDRLVRLELDEFERTGADRMTAHLARWHVAGIDRREPVREKHQECRLRPLQMEGDLVIPVRFDLFEVAIPGFERIEAELVARLFEQEVPGALDVLGRERLAVMPFDALAQRQGQRGPFLVPRPA